MGAMVTENGRHFSDKFETKSRVHVREQVGPLIWPTKSINQMDPVVFYPTIIQETAFGAQNQ